MTKPKWQPGPPTKTGWCWVKTKFVPYIEINRGDEGK